MQCNKSIYTNTNTLLAQIYVIIIICKEQNMQNRWIIITYQYKS